MLIEKNLIVAASGASGSTLFLDFFQYFPFKSFFLNHLSMLEHMQLAEELEPFSTQLKLNLCIIHSPAFAQVFLHEQKVTIQKLQEEISHKLSLNQENSQKYPVIQRYKIEIELVFLPYKNVAETVASGSSQWEAMVVIPCSMGTVARLAQGFSQNLLERAADVALKEKRPLIIVPRESPLSTLHLKNLYEFSKNSSVSIQPAMVPYYLDKIELPQINEFLVSRIASTLKCPVSKKFYQKVEEKIHD